MMLRFKVAFLVWLGVMIPLITALTIIGHNCESCVMKCGADIAPGTEVTCVP